MLRDAERVTHILESIDRLAEYLQGVDLSRLEADAMLQDAVLRRLTVIGEAAGKVSAATADRFPAVPWRVMADFRNFVVHAYHRIDWRIVWAVLRERLPTLRPTLSQIQEILVAEDSAS